MKTDLRDLIENCEAALRAGRTGDISKLLQGLTPLKISREFRLPLARISRRADLVTLGLKILTPIIYPEKKGISDPASEAERAEFATLRLKIGSVHEALNILSGLSDEKVIEAPMLRAFCHMAQWDYQPAAVELRKFLSLNPDPYRALIARVNLAAALVSTYEMQEASDLLEQLIAQTKESGYDRLRANCYELRSQIYLETHENSKCRADLQAASDILSLQKTTDQLYVQKWLAVLEARDRKSKAPLIKLKKEAFERHNWETVREMDFQILQIKFELPLFQHLYWGTPFESYRNRMRKVFGEQPDCQHRIEPKESYRYGSSGGPCVDLREAAVTQGELNPGKQVHRLLAVLLQDFYKPISVGALYADIFPGEYYNVFSSPDRVHQALRRGRRWLEQNKIPASIQEVDGRFKLNLEGEVHFIIGPSLEQVTSNSVLLQRIGSALKTESEFSSADIVKATGVSKPTAVRFLRWALENGHFEKQGTGRATRYLFAA